MVRCNKADANLFCTSEKKESVLFICNSYMARRMGRGAFKASCVICIKKIFDYYATFYTTLPKNQREMHTYHIIGRVFQISKMIYNYDIFIKHIITWKHIFVSSSRPSRGSALLTSVSSA